MPDECKIASKSIRRSAGKADYSWHQPVSGESAPGRLISRDIGVRLTVQTWNLTTHKIAPDVDFDRTYLLQDLLMSGCVERYGYVGGVGPAPAPAPRRNLTGDPYYTDGLRAVIFLSNQTTSIGKIERLAWDVPPLPREETR
jgi:hypothetical protein